MRKHLLTFTAAFVLCFGTVKSQTHATDVTITGSQCIGIDCPTNPSYGFDTQRFQENNLRIHFDDSSNSASFPGNDWRITINDTSNGGDNHFSIEDATAGRNIFKLLAGAPSNSFYMNASGNIGLGTATPVLEVQITDGDSPAIRLEQDGSSGFTQQTWDVAGNETNFFIRDVTNGSKLPFRIRPDAPTNSIFINTNGDIGVGTANPALDLHVVDGDGPGLRLEQSGPNAQTWDMVGSDTTFTIQDATNGSTLPFTITSGAPDNALFINTSGNVALGGTDDTHKLYVNGDAAINGDIYVLSDRRIKKNIEDSDYGLKEVMQLSAKKYQYDAGSFKNLNLPSNDQIGLIAQEVEGIVPEAISTEHATVELNGEKIALKGVNYIKLVPVLIQAVQEQQVELDVKNKEISQLRTELDQLKEQVSWITSHLQEEGLSSEAEHDHNHAENPAHHNPNQDDINAPAMAPKAPKPIIQLNNGRND